MREIKFRAWDGERLFQVEGINFDYKFKKGICQNMNASFLLKKMKIVE